MIDTTAPNVTSKLTEWADDFTQNFTQAQLTHARAEADQRGLRLLLQALFREKLLDSEQLIFDSATDTVWLPHWKSKTLFRFEGLKSGMAGSWQLNGPMHYLKNHQKPLKVTTSAAALKLLSSLFEVTISPPDIARFQAELDNSTENDTFCLAYRQAWARRLEQEIPAGDGMISWLQKKSLYTQQHARFNGCLLLEQWGTLGHPWHPNYKTKIGLSKQDVFAMSPEFEANIDIAIAAVRADAMHIESMPAMPGFSTYLAWFEHTFPQVFRHWKEALLMRNLTVSEWLPLPMHPWQAQRHLPSEFPFEIATEKLILLSEVTCSAAPTMSFRTLVPQRSSHLPLMKLPVSLRLTSVQRTLSPKSARMGPRVSALLEKILDREQHFGDTLAIVCEQIGLHYIDPQGNDDHARHLSILYRANPMQHAEDNMFPVPVGALFAPSPIQKNGTSRALITELVASAFQDNAQGAIDFYRRYTEIVVGATLGAYLLYGIGFEAHQQNSFLLIDAKGMPQKLLLRDFGDIRIHAEALRLAGLTLACHKAGHTVFEDRQPVRDKLLHAVFLCHLGELALLLTQIYELPETALWIVLRDATQAVFDQLKPRIPDTLWQQEYALVLEQPWPAKSFIRMRLADSADDEVRSMPNPLMQLDAARTNGN
ncbi:IucA/IucC family protein [Glaciimonas immobilis]|uniref:Siderophore synthetase component n=1 Tax=Glaciimonas immobilis TaxID=728004 RepID=A0A840RY32_9BURK|nr:IucA/IucC family protein [Glaciimonas immobilis]KAF3996765.1 siderophore synthetase [Glaciimonas immobilis]MBB5201309.1 siderophore synthetase component [Glaciimonas immobilis]